MGFTYSEALQKGSDILKAANIDEYQNDAWLLLEYVTGISKSSFFLKRTEQIDEVDKEKYLELINKRSTHYPVQYITNEQNFYGRVFYVDENVLIPRFDTEVLVESLLGDGVSGSFCENSKDDTIIKIKILDICTGSGCILLSLAAELGKKYSVEATGVDISAGAIGVAKRNAENLDIAAQFIEADVLKDSYLDSKYDIIVSNPPYIESSVISGLMSEVKDYEPMIALDGGDDGLIFYRKISKDAMNHLSNAGILAFEIGHNQGDAVSSIMKSDGYKDIKVIKDYAGNTRVCIGRK